MPSKVKILNYNNLHLLNLGEKLSIDGAYYKVVGLDFQQGTIEAKKTKEWADNANWTA